MLKKVSLESIALCIVSAMILSFFGVAIAITEAAPINTDLYKNARTDIPSIPIPSQITDEPIGEDLNSFELLSEQSLLNQDSPELILNENAKEETQHEDNSLIKDLLLSIQNTIDNLL